MDQTTLDIAGYHQTLQTSLGTPSQRQPGTRITPTRLIGIDLGAKTIGLALSDVSRIVATPLETIERTKFKADVARLLSLIETHGVAGLVLGYPVNLDGSSGPRVQATRAFARNLNAICPLPVLLWDERLSTAAADRMLIDADASRRRRAEVIDKIAATIILQGALDRLRIIPKEPTLSEPPQR